MSTDEEVLKEATRLLGSGKRLALCTVIEKKGSGPRTPGAKMIVAEDGRTFGTIGGGTFERALINESLKALQEGRPRKTVFNLAKEEKEGAIKTGLICGGELTVFIDIIEPRQRFIIVGSGHVAWPLAKLADIVGFRIIIVDDNRELATKERFPMAERIITGTFTKILDTLEVEPNDFVAIVHGEPEHDYLALEQIIKKKPFYVGLIGSKAKVTALAERLKTKGVNEKDLAVLHAPLGLDIGAQTPEEIGISILAEIINERRKRRRKEK